MRKHCIRTLWLLVLAGGILFAAQRGSGRYAVILTDPPVAQRFASAGGGQAAAGRTYRAQILASQATLRQELLKRNFPVTGAVQTLLNAVFVAATSDQAAELRALPGVKAVVPLQRFRRRLDRAVQLLNVPAAWAQLGGTQNAGAGMKIAILDTGIDQTHPGFQDSSLTPPPGFPICSGKDCAFTSNKIIVARSYVAALAAGSQPNPALDSRPDDLSARDRVGHGTALAMIAAGVTNSGPVDTITGVAPKAFLGNYKIFGSPGVNDFTTGDVIIQALEDALNDHMDIAELSLGSPAFSGPLDQGAVCGLPSGTPCDAEAQAVEAAVRSGLSVVVAAGNAGDWGSQLPTLNTISSPATAPSAIAVGASTNSHAFVSSVRVAGPNVPQNLQLIPAVFGDGPLPSGPVTAPLVDVATLDGTGFACSPLPPGSLNGMFALAARTHTLTTCPFATKVGNAQAAGAVGVILTQESGQGDPFGPGGLVGTSIPTVMVGFSDGQALKSYVASHPGVNTTIDPTLRPVDVSIYNEVAEFSSRGPSIDFRLKPELVAVGTNVYMATQRFDPNSDMYDPSGYMVADGTSFSTPMVAGALALVKQANPSFIPSQLKSAVVNTATQDVTEFGSTASVVSAGNGKLNAGTAIQAVVSADPTAVSFGALVRGTPPSPQTLIVHYAGAGSATLTLTTSPVFGTAPSLDKTVLSMGPAQRDQTVTLTLPGTVPSPGIYEGGILIQGAGPMLRVPYLYVVGDGVVFDAVQLNGYGFDGTVNQQMPTGGIAFKLIDQYGVPVPGVRVRYSVPFGGSISNADTQTDGNGIAGADAFLGPTVGAQTFTATAGGLIIPFPGTARPLPTIAAVVNSASLAAGPGISPGSYITLFGSGLSDFTDGTPIAALLPSLDLVSVSFDVPSANLSLPGRLLYVSPTQINLQVPWELSGQTSVQMKVTVVDSPGQVLTVPVGNYAPAVYLVQGLAAALDLNDALIATQNPAHAGQVIQLYLNGLGPVDNPPAIGTVAQAQPLSNTLAQPAVTIGGKQAVAILFSGLTPTTDGLYQINLQLAADTPAGLQPLIVTIGGVSSAPVSIPVQ